MRIAVIADIHGNRPALDAVLADLAARGGAALVVDLGDGVSGPLWPAETLARLRDLDAVTVRGNHDRAVAAGPPDRLGPSDRFAWDALTPAERSGLGALPATAEPVPGLLACHGTPADDETYLLDHVAGGRLAASDPAAIAAALRPAAALGRVSRATRVVLCGHSHRPAVVALPGGPLVLNPGSVGCPAYRDPSGPAHVSEAGAPHARYALLDLPPEGPASVALLAVSYAWEEAARRAEANGRPDWARALRTGFMDG